MTRPKSSTAPARERRGGKVLCTVWRRLYRAAEACSACGELTIGVVGGALFWLIVLGVSK